MALPLSSNVFLGIVELCLLFVSPRRKEGRKEESKERREGGREGGKEGGRVRNIIYLFLNVLQGSTEILCFYAQYNTFIVIVNVNLLIPKKL